MEYLQRISKTYLARNTRRVISTVQRGQTAVIESHGEPEVAIIDITDFYILRAVLRYYAQRPEVDAASGLRDDAVKPDSSIQERYDLVVAHYLAGSISLARAAELLNLPWLELRTRFLRLEVPLRTAPGSFDEVRADVETALAGPVSTRHG